MTFSLSDNDTISWPSNQLKLSETANIDRLQFKCSIELLHIIQSDSFMNFLSRTPLTTTAYPSCQWDVNPNLMKLFTSSEPGRVYYNQANINKIWCLSCHPNGFNKENEGELILSLELIRLSPNLSFIECQFELKSNHKSIKLAWQSPKNAKFTYNNTKYSWPSGLFSNLSLSEQDSLEFTVDIVITKIGDIYGQKIKKSHWGQYGIMHNSVIQSMAKSQSHTQIKNKKKPPSIKSQHEPSWSMEVLFIS